MGNTLDHGASRVTHGLEGSSVAALDPPPFSLEDGASGEHDGLKVRTPLLYVPFLMRDERTVYRLNTLTEFPMVVLAWIGHQPDPTSHQHDAFCGLAKFLIQMDVYTMDKLGLPCNHRSVRDQADIFRERIPQRFGPSFAIIRDHGCLELLTSDADRDDGARDAGDERSTRGQKRD